MLDDFRLGIVDVPGHERFVRNMLAGATGMDIAMLVVAADDSIKQQTREHLEILRLLNLPAGLIAITKCDIADPDWIPLVEEEVRELVADTFLADAPMVRTSAHTGDGLDELRNQLTKAAQKAAKKLARAPTDLRNQALLNLADALEHDHSDILSANTRDYTAAQDEGMNPAMLARLLLTPDRLQGMAQDVRNIAALPDPVGETIETNTLDNGLRLEKRRVPLGVIAAVRRGGAIDFLSRVLALLGQAVPNFWLGLILILLISVQLGWLPTGGRSEWRSIILPAFTLGTAPAAAIMLVQAWAAARRSPTRRCWR